MKIERFEDAEVWRLARDLAKRVYLITNKESLKYDFSFKDQLRKCSVSIMANIAEGFERKGNKEFVQFLFIAKGSAGELRSHLYLASDVGYIDEKEFTDLSQDLEKISKSLSGFIKYLRAVG